MVTRCVDENDGLHFKAAQRLRHPAPPCPASHSPSADTAQVSLPTSASHLPADVFCASQCFWHGDTPTSSPRCVLQVAPVSSAPPPSFSAHRRSCVEPQLRPKIFAAATRKPGYIFESSKTIASGGELALARKYQVTKPIQISRIGKTKEFAPCGETLWRRSTCQTRSYKESPAGIKL